MDFFSHQEKAKKYSKVLISYFLIALILIVLAVNVVIYHFFIFLEFYPYTPQNWFSEGAVYYVSVGTVLLILTGSLYRWSKLKAGGHVVAEMVGASRLDLHTSDLKRRQLINVVEEMSIASGVPLPVIYVMENEPGINAFVAGYLPTEAIMVVTQGTLESLNREELQGVVAHEYSHILNGDMQINIKLMAVLAGILMISVSGRILMHGSTSSRRHTTVRGKSGSALVVLGLLLLLVGYIGVLCGRMIKAAVSRQREFLADAAAVQFTRNPQGIASALNKIAEAGSGSKIKNAHAEDMSHMCFSEALSLRFNKRLATHPPLNVRINRIYPGFLSRVKARKMTENISKSKEPLDTDFAVNESISMLSAAAPLTPGDVSNSVGQIDQAHIEYAVSMHQSFSDEIMSAIHYPETAKAVIWCMILAKMDSESNMTLAQNCLGDENIKNINLYKDEIFKLKNSQRLPLFDMLLPALKLMSEDERRGFIVLSENLIKSDKRYSLFEFVLLSLLQQHLSKTAGANRKIKYYSFKPLTEELQLTFSVMAQFTGSAPAERVKVYQKVVKGFAIKDHELVPVKIISAKKIKHALQKLALLSPLLKRNIIEACADIAMDDGKLRATEAELLRAISESLDCPMPPLLPQAE